MTGRGFALVNTPLFFEDGLFPRLHRLRTVLPPHDKRWWRFPQLARYACWLEELLDKALPEEVVCLISLEFRLEPAGFEDREVDQLHADGSYLRSVCTLYGPATVYCDAGIVRPVPGRRTLLMTAMNRARAIGLPCTLHRRPGAGPERAVIVCSFEPGPDQPLPSSVYHQAAEAHSPRRRLRAGRFQSGLRN
jgi:hypothetical protein